MKVNAKMVKSVLYRRRLARGLEELEAKLGIALQESASRKICFDNCIVYLVDGQIVIKQIPGMDKYQLRIKEFAKESL